jgi:hypothetical protein
MVDSSISNENKLSQNDRHMLILRRHKPMVPEPHKRRAIGLATYASTAI